MTLLAIWHRRHYGDIYAIADSRLVGSNGSVLTDHAPKFTVAHVHCYAQVKDKGYDKLVVNRSIAVGFAGSSSVAFATIATLQAYLASICVDKGKATPSMEQIAQLGRQVLDENVRHFGAIWQDAARCDLVLFGRMPVDKGLEAFLLSTKNGTRESDLATVLNLNLRGGDKLCCFGSGAKYFQDEFKKETSVGKDTHPSELLKRIIAGNERPDIGGAIQIAIADKSGVSLPQVLLPRPELGEFVADVSFLGRDVTTIEKVGDCTIGRQADGPEWEALRRMRREAGYQGY